ncbi:hypothetical protein TNCT_529421 [Trichonephila clavata]|uniref:Uncharacterized protein n=1 Tax=Trichonephila clavata TaxID=2740835 RepID=A0A8X6FH92_TRICU|nr:hypothetical protein TNCT_529421 [Trichonephila clavata]
MVLWPKQSVNHGRVQPPTNRARVSALPDEPSIIQLSSRFEDSNFKCVQNSLQTFSCGFKKKFPSVRRRRKKKSSSVIVYQRKSPNLPPLKLHARKLGLVNGLSKEQIRL